MRKKLSRKFVTLFLHSIEESFYETGNHKGFLGYKTSNPLESVAKITAYMSSGTLYADEIVLAFGSAAIDIDGDSTVVYFPNIDWVD